MISKHFFDKTNKIQCRLCKNIQTTNRWRPDKVKGSRSSSSIHWFLKCEKTSCWLFLSPTHHLALKAISKFPPVCMCLYIISEHQLSKKLLCAKLEFRSVINIDGTHSLTNCKKNSLRYTFAYYMFDTFYDSHFLDNSERQSRKHFFEECWKLFKCSQFGLFLMDFILWKNAGGGKLVYKNERT